MAENTAEKKQPKLDAQGRSYGTGRRKNAVARCWLKKGTGKIQVNGKGFEPYFSRPVLRMIIMQVFEVTNSLGNFDILATTSGGGMSGQAGALRHAISKALTTHDESTHDSLRAAGFLTRDSRVVESKKYGRHKARRSTQFVKR